MARIDVVHPSAWGVAIPFVPTTPAGDFIPWDGDDIHIEFRNTHASPVTVTIKPVEDMEYVDEVGPFYVPERSFTIASGADASFFFDKEFASAYLNELRALVITYTDGHEDLLIRPVTIASTVAALQDASPQSVAPNYFVAPTAVYNPTATFSQGIVPPFIAATGSIYQPTVDFQRIVRPNFVSAVTSVFNPAVDFQRIVVPNFVAGTGQVFNPKTSSTVPVDFITSTTLIHEPTLTIGGITVQVDAVPSTSVVFPPIFIGPQSIFPNVVDPAGSVFGPTTVLYVLPDYLDSTSVVMNPTWSHGNRNVPVDFIASATAVFQPVIIGAQFVTPNFLASGAAIFAPTITTGNVDVTPDLLNSAAVVSQPSVGLSIAPALLSSTATIYSPTVATSGSFIEDYFSAFTYTGTGSALGIVNGIDLAGHGGMVWFKQRSQASTDHVLYDTARGTTKELITNSTGAESTQANGVTAFNVDGFDVGSRNMANGSTQPIISWTFRKAAKFFDVVTYTGNGANRTISHSLGVAPGMIIIKRTDSTSPWTVYHRSLANTEYIVLNTTAAKVTGATTYWNSATATSTDFSLGTSTDVNANGGTYVAYLFAHDTTSDGIIQCGSFTTNGSGEGAAINLGWEPQFILWKDANYSAGNDGDWNISDSARGLVIDSTSMASKFLEANTTAAEQSSGYAGVKANGFRSGGTASHTHVYMAIRKGLMKQPTDATKVFAINARTGTGAAATVTAGSITQGVDLVISKARGTAGYSASLQDRLRGNASQLAANQTAAETTDTSEVTAFNMSSVSVGTSGGLGNINTNAVTYINYLIKQARGFFDIVCYTGTGSAHTEAHNLGVVPELIITKARNNASNWLVYYGDATAALIVNQTGAATTGFTGAWNNTAPTSSVFTVGNNAGSNANTYTYAAYLFASVAGVSKIGTYTGNATANAINCGFAAGARFVMIKRLDSTGDWYFWDTTRGIVSGNDPYLLMNSTAAEVTNTDYIDPSNAGFEISSAAPAAINANGGSFLFLAVA